MQVKSGGKEGEEKGKGVVRKFFFIIVCQNIILLSLGTSVIYNAFAPNATRLLRFKKWIMSRQNFLSIKNIWYFEEGLRGTL